MVIDAGDGRKFERYRVRFEYGYRRLLFVPKSAESIYQKLNQCP